MNSSAVNAVAILQLTLPTRHGIRFRAARFPIRPLQSNIRISIGSPRGDLHPVLLQSAIRDLHPVILQPNIRYTRCGQTCGTRNENVGTEMGDSYEERYTCSVGYNHDSIGSKIERMNQMNSFSTLVFVVFYLLYQSIGAHHFTGLAGPTPQDGDA